MTELVVHQPSAVSVTVPSEKRELLKRTFCRGATDDEFELFVAVCNRLQLDPFAKQIYAHKRWDEGLKRHVMTFLVGIDGLRLEAQRSGEYQGQTEPEWCGPDLAWMKAWPHADRPPHAARVGIWRKGFREPVYGVAHFSEYVQTTQDGTPTQRWRKAPATQLSKCAEALGLRKGFPKELSGIYAPEEMDHLEPVKPEDIEPAPMPEIDTMKRSLAAFEWIKNQLSPEEYYKVLGAEGFEHANEIKNIEDRRRVYGLMQTALKLKLERENANVQRELGDA